MPISLSILVSSWDFARRWTRLSKKTCKASRLSISHSFLRKWSHKVRPGTPCAAGYAARRVSKALGSRMKGKDCTGAGVTGRDLGRADGSSWLSMNERIGTVDEVGAAPSVYSSIRARRAILEGVK